MSTFSKYSGVRQRSFSDTATLSRIKCNLEEAQMTSIWPVSKYNMTDSKENLCTKFVGCRVA